MTEVRPPLTVPDVQVVRGAPDDAELAALVAGLVAAASQRDGSGDGSGGTPGAADAWTDTARRTRPVAGSTWRPGPSAWRWSLHP